MSVAAAGSGVAAEACLPWPEGDPGALADAASTVGSGADSLTSAATRLGGEASAASGWKGEGATAFPRGTGLARDGDRFPGEVR